MNREEIAKDHGTLLEYAGAILNHLGCAGCMNGVNMRSDGKCNMELRRFEEEARRQYRKYVDE